MARAQPLLRAGGRPGPHLQREAGPGSCLRKASPPRLVGVMCRQSGGGGMPLSTPGGKEPAPGGRPPPHAESHSPDLQFQLRSMQQLGTSLLLVIRHRQPSQCSTASGNDGERLGWRGLWGGLCLKLPHLGGQTARELSRLSPPAPKALGARQCPVSKGKSAGWPRPKTDPGGGGRCACHGPMGGPPRSSRGVRGG